MTNADIALARRFWIHVHEGGTLTSVDVGRMVTALEEQDAAFTNLHREYDRRGDRIEELKDKLNYAVGEWRDYDKTIEQMEAERLANRAAIMRLEAKLAKAVEMLRALGVADAILAELTGGNDE